MDGELYKKWNDGATPEQNDITRICREINELNYQRWEEMSNLSASVIEEPFDEAQWLINKEMERLKKTKALRQSRRTTIGRFVTLTNSEAYRDWGKNEWVKAIDHYVQYKNITTDYWFCAIEKQMDGTYHAHIIFIYPPTGEDRHEGLGQKHYAKHWRYGEQVKLVKMNFKTNPNALTDLLNYLKKDGEETIYGQSKMWDMVTI